MKTVDQPVGWSWIVSEYGSTEELFGKMVSFLESGAIFSLREGTANGEWNTLGNKNTTHLLYHPFIIMFGSTVFFQCGYDFCNILLFMHFKVHRPSCLYFLFIGCSWMNRVFWNEIWVFQLFLYIFIFYRSFPLHFLLITQRHFLLKAVWCLRKTF